MGNCKLIQKYFKTLLSMNFSGSLSVVSDLTSVELKLLSSAASRQWTLLFLLLQTPEVPNVLQAPEEPEQHGEEQGGAGRPARQRLQGAAAAHGAARRLALRPNTADGLKLLRQQTEIINTWSSIHDHQYMSADQQQDAADRRHRSSFGASDFCTFSQQSSRLWE